MICPSRHTIFVYKYSYKYVYDIIISWLNPSAFPKKSLEIACWNIQGLNMLKGLIHSAMQDRQAAEHL